MIPEEEETSIEDFYYLFLLPCVSTPKKYIDYKFEIEEEWKEVRRKHIEWLNTGQITKEQEKWLKLCIETFRLLGK
jgi:hypothetical protein